MFPKILDNAEVLLYSPKGNYGTYNYTSGEICSRIFYYVIAKYPDDNSYYLFGCNSEYEVKNDYCFDSIDECKDAVINFGYDFIWQYEDKI